MRRLFYVALGATAGVLLVRKLTETANKWTPEGLAGQAGDAGERLTGWWNEVQHYAAEREHELREALGLDDESDGGRE